MTQKQRRESLVGEQSDKAALEEIVKRAMRSDREALKALCKSIARSVFFRVRSRLHNPQDAEDASQEVLIRVCEKIGSLRDPKSFGAWLNSIIINEINRFSAKSMKHADIINIEEYLSSMVDESEGLLPEEYALREEDRRMIMEIVDNLPQRQWEAVMLHYYEDMSLTEVAAAMNITKQGVSYSLALAREKIKKELETRLEVPGALRSMAGLPIGLLLTQVLHEEAALVSFAPEQWIETAISNSAEIGGTSAPKSALTAGLSGFLRATGIIVIAAAAIVAILLYGGGLLFNPEYSLDPPAPVEGSIIFPGDATSQGHINPTSASAWASDNTSELSAQSWSITAFGSEEVLYSGLGGSVSAELVLMQRNGEDGEYSIRFYMEDAAGNRYLLIRPFSIRSLADGPE
ncbi:MAG: sigma-70 family RNA polymerase sigma factor [Eggerthellaceae bacterium]|nr:sigma-70 family RNA polymerase sigma factor [Eggerthellaceae bacterium]